MKIGIVGARVAGSYAGQLLAALGHEVILFDGSLDQEKPCGGGVTAKALLRMGWFNQLKLPHTEVVKIRLVTHDGYAADLPLRHSIHVFPRMMLDTSLRNQATKTGGVFHSERVSKIAAEKNSWFIKTASGETEVQFLIGADGANSSVRKMLAGPHRSADLVLTLGYTLPGALNSDTLLIQFQESGFLGYLWAFPCLETSSVGIGRMLPGAHAANLRERLDGFVSNHTPWCRVERKFYSALIPCLSRRTLVGQQVCGRNWALLGDAAGFADPVTAEGIFYALRSAELLAESFQKGNPMLYEPAWRRDFGWNLENAAVWRDRFYGSLVLSQTFIRRALQTIRYSKNVALLLDELIAGNLSYQSLFQNLVFRSPNIILQCFRNRAAQRLRVERSSV